MSNQVQFLLQAEEAQAVAAFLKVVDAQKQTEQQTTKVTKANRDLERAAKRVFDETRSPMERHNKQMAELNRLVESGAIDQDTYRRAVDRTCGEASFRWAGAWPAQEHGGGCAEHRGGVGVR